MKKATGAVGDIDFITGHNACFDRFSFTQTQRLIDTSCFGEEDEDFTGSTQGGSVHAEGTIKYDGASSAPGADGINPNGGEVTLTYAPGCTHVFNAVIEQISFNVVKIGESRVMFDARKKGAVVETWDESSS